MLPAFCIKQFRQVMLCLFWIMRPKLGETKRNKKNLFLLYKARIANLKPVVIQPFPLWGEGILNKSPFKWPPKSLSKLKFYLTTTSRGGAEAL